MARLKATFLQWGSKPMNKREVNYNTEKIKAVVRDDFVHAIHPDGIDINTMKLLRLVIAQCKMTDKEFYQYDFKIKDIASKIDIDPSNLYKDAKEMCIKMMQMVLIYGGGGPKDKWRMKHIVESCEYFPNKGEISMLLHKDMAEMFLCLTKNDRFAQIPMDVVFMLKSKYAIRIYELICEKMGKEKPFANHAVGIHLSIEEIRAVTNTNGKKIYDKISNLKSRIVLPAIKEIEEATRIKEHENYSGWTIIIKDVKKGRKINGFDLEIWTKSGYGCAHHARLTDNLFVTENN